MNKILFYRWDNKLFHYAIIKIENDTSKVLFRIPKILPQAKEITKHITHSLASGNLKQAHVIKSVCEKCGRPCDGCMIDEQIEKQEYNGI